MKQSVILVNSQINLLFAIQLKKTLFASEKFDLILSSLVPGMEEISKKEELKQCFDNVYFVDYNKVSRKTKLLSVFFPKYFFESILGVPYIEYTDIFFWNPTLFLYFYLFENKRRGKSINMHLYGDAMGAYVCDEPICGKLFKYNFINKYLENKYGYKPIGECKYDYYVMGKKYVSFVPKHEIVDVPIIDVNDQKFVEYINKVFDFGSIPEVVYNNIFMDVHHEKFGDSETGINFLNTLLKYVPRDDFAIRPHPRQDKSIYDKIGSIPLIDFVIPWELYCINYDITGKTVITFGSSSALLPLIFTGAKYTVLCIDLENTFNTIFKDEWKAFINTLQKENSIYVVYTLEELERMMNQLYKDE